jgi:hypothetical protein
MLCPNDSLMMMLMTKKLLERQKMTKKRLSVNPKKNDQNGARHGRRETAERKGHKERL